MEHYETKSNGIIHESRWAITRRCENKVRKEFLHNAFSKIEKEVMLLQLSLANAAKLSFDDQRKCWVCESEYLDLLSIVDGISIEELALQLKAVFNNWSCDNRYRNLVTNDWLDVVCPWYTSLLQQYLPDATKAISWLNQSHGEHFIHGDFTLSNVYLNSDKQVLILDYENATLGPFLWDETTLVYSLIEHKQYEMAKELFEVFLCEPEILYTISCIRLAQSVRKSQNVVRRKEAHRHISQMYFAVK